MASYLLGKRCLASEHVTHDLAENQIVCVFCAISGFRVGCEKNLKEALVKPVLLPPSSSTSTSLPIRSLNDVGDCARLCGGRNLCLAWINGSKFELGMELKINEHPNILPALAREALEEYFEGEVEEVEVEEEGGDAAASYHRWQPWQLRVNFFSLCCSEYE